MRTAALKTPTFRPFCCRANGSRPSGKTMRRPRAKSTTTSRILYIGGGDRECVFIYFFFCYFAFVVVVGLFFFFYNVFDRRLCTISFTSATSTLRGRVCAQKTIVLLIIRARTPQRRVLPQNVSFEVRHYPFLFRTKIPYTVYYTYIVNTDQREKLLETKSNTLRV